MQATQYLIVQKNIQQDFWSYWTGDWRSSECKHAELLSRNNLCSPCGEN